MPLTVTCPACHATQTVPDAAAGRTVRCPNCGAAAAAPGRPRRGGLVLLALLALAAAAGGGGWWYVAHGRSVPAEYADPDGVFTARFPNPPAAEVRATADPAMLKWGERTARATAGRREYAVAVFDGLNPGDQEPGPAARDAQRAGLLATAAANGGATALTRAVTHGGHPAEDVVLADKADGRLTALRLVVGERAAVRMSVAGSGDPAGAEAFLADAAAFFDGVHLGEAFGPPLTADPVPATAAELAAAYRADPAAADARFKGKLVRVTGPVAAVADGGQKLDVGAGADVVEVRRAAKARMAVPVRGAGGSVTATGRCLGLDGPRVVVADAVVLRPPAK